MKGLLLILALVALTAGCGGSAGESGRSTGAASGGSAPFAYDASTPLRYVDRGVVNPAYPIKVHDVSFTTPSGRRVDGMLAVPPGKGPFPGALYLHGSPGDRTQLLVPATWLAARGVVALTITMPAGTIPAASAGKERLVAERKAAVGTVVAARRAVDVLQSLPQVDDDRIGLVGWSAGARFGAIIAGVEPRIGAFDLFSGGSLPVQEYAAEAPEELRPAVIRELGVVDPLRWVAQARPGTILLQNGRTDEIVPRKALDALADAAGAAAEVRWYDQGHTPSKQAYLDQLEWMAAKLGVDGPVVKGAASGP
jgi:dienelactone hydrolase